MKPRIFWQGFSICSIKFPIEQATLLRSGNEVGGGVTQKPIFPITLVQTLQKDSKGKEQISWDHQPTYYSDNEVHLYSWHTQFESGTDQGLSGSLGVVLTWLSGYEAYREIHHVRLYQIHTHTHAQFAQRHLIYKDQTLISPQSPSNRSKFY